MDPISAILAALAAGAAAAAKETVGTAIKDGYEGLKSLLKRKLSGKTLAAAAVDAHSEDTMAAETVLRPAMKDAGADADGELLEAARALLAKADPQGKVAARYQLNITGDVQGLVQGDHSQVTMTFGTSRSSKE